MLNAKYHADDLVALMRQHNEIALVVIKYSELFMIVCLNLGELINENEEFALHYLDTDIAKHFMNFYKSHLICASERVCWAILTKPHLFKYLTGEVLYKAYQKYGQAFLDSLNRLAAQYPIDASKFKNAVLAYQQIVELVWSSPTELKPLIKAANCDPCELVRLSKQYEAIALIVIRDYRPQIELYHALEIAQAQPEAARELMALLKSEPHLRSQPDSYTTEPYHEIKNYFTCQSLRELALTDKDLCLSILKLPRLVSYLSGKNFIPLIEKHGRQINEQILNEEQLRAAYNKCFSAGNQRLRELKQQHL